MQQKRSLDPQKPHTCGASPHPPPHNTEANHLEATLRCWTLLCQDLFCRRGSKKSYATTRITTAPQTPTHSQQQLWALSTSQHSHERATTTHRTTSTQGRLPPPMATTKGDAPPQAQTRSRSDAFKKDATPKTPPMLVHKWT